MRRKSGSAMLIVVIGLCLTAMAKDKPLIGVILYQGDSGPAYAQVTEFMLNGKTEVFLCSGTETLDNNSYKKLPKASLAQATALERGANGVLTMFTASGSSCILPQNIKLEKRQNVSLREIVDMGAVQAKLISRSNNTTDTIPAVIKPGTRIEFVAAANVELAEYLRASRAQSIPLWTEYLRQFPSAAHTAEAHGSLAKLITGEGEAELAAYTKSAGGSSPSFERLRSAKVKADDSRRVLLSNPRNDALAQEIGRQVQLILDLGRGELDAYQKALADRTVGYEHLKSAKTHLEHARIADPDHLGLSKIETDVNTQSNNVDRGMALADSLTAAGRFDEALDAIGKYSQFATELPRVEAVIEAAFRNRRNRGNDFVTAGKLPEAIAEYRKALEIRKDAATSEALKTAEADFELANNKETSQQALEESHALAASKRFIEAYEKLSDLPAGQRKYVEADMQALAKDYVTDLTTRAGTLTKLHIPIRGRADEDAARTAFDYLTKAAALDANEAIRIPLDLVSDAVSEYYMKQAQRLLDKPRGYGIGLGWLMVKEGQRYKSDLEGLRDMISKYAPDYDTKAKLSISIYFRDQTSRRDSLGFADQLADTVASGLEGSNLPGIKTITRKDRNAMEADVINNTNLSNLQLVGDIIKHQVDKKTDTQRLTSHYRAGHREVKNPEWIEANRNVEAGQRTLDTARGAYAAAAPKMKKREAAAAVAQLQAMSSRLDQLKLKLSGVQETLLQNITEAYTYTRRTISYTASVEVALRLVDPAVENSKLTDSIVQDLPKTVVILENVKPEDTDGIVGEGDPLDEISLLAEAEAQAKGIMVKKLIDWVKDAPPKILEEARTRASNTDFEAAAERYIVYLNSTAMKSTPQRVEAQQFLRSNFNVTTVKIEP